MAVSKPTLGADTYPLSCILEEEEEEEREEGEDTCKNVLLSLTEFLEVEGRGQRYKASGGSANGSCWSLGEVLGENKGEWETAVEGLRAAHEALNWGLYQATSVKAGVTRDTRLRWKPTSKQLRAIYGAGSVDDWTTYEQVKYSEEQHNELVTATRIRQTDVGDEDKQIGKVRLRGGGCGFKKFIWRSSSSQPSTPIRLNIRNLPISSPILQDPNTLGILPSNMTARKTQYTHQRRDPNAPALPAMRPFRDLSSGVDSLTDPLFEQSSVASFYQEPHMYTTQSRFLGEQDQRISQIDWPPPPKTVPGDRNEPLPRKPLSMSSVHSDHSVSFLRSALESSEQGALRGHNSYGRQQNKKFLGPPSFPLANESAPTRQGKSEGEEPLPGLASPSNLSLERPSGRSLRRGHRGPDLGVSNGHDQEVHSNDRPDVPMKGYHANGSADADGARRSIWDGGGCQSVTPDDAISAILTKKHHGQRAIPSLEERSDSEPGEYNIANRSQRRIIRQRFHQEAAELYDSHQARLRGIDGDANKSEAEKVRATTEENETFKLLMDQAAKNTSFQIEQSWYQDEFIQVMMDIEKQLGHSKTPLVFRKLGKAVKWVLAVPDDPETKTFSRRKRSMGSGGGLRLERNTTNATRSGSQRSPRRSQSVDSPRRRRPIETGPLRNAGRAVRGVSSLIRGNKTGLAEITKRPHPQHEAEQEVLVEPSGAGWPTLSQAGWK